MPACAGQVGDEYRGPTGAYLGYTSDVVEVVERYFYRPLRKPLSMLVRQAKRLQSGRSDAYVTYVLVAVVGMLTLRLTVTDEGAAAPTVRQWSLDAAFVAQFLGRRPRASNGHLSAGPSRNLISSPTVWWRCWGWRRGSSSCTS